METEKIYRKTCLMDKITKRNQIHIINFPSPKCQGNYLLFLNPNPVFSKATNLIFLYFFLGGH